MRQMRGRSQAWLPDLRDNRALPGGMEHERKNILVVGGRGMSTYLEMSEIVGLVLHPSGVIP